MECFTVPPVTEAHEVLLHPFNLSHDVILVPRVAYKHFNHTRTHTKQRKKTKYPNVRSDHALSYYNSNNLLAQLTSWLICKVRIAAFNQRQRNRPALRHTAVTGRRHDDHVIRRRTAGVECFPLTVVLDARRRRRCRQARRGCITPHTTSRVHYFSRQDRFDLIKYRSWDQSSRSRRIIQARYI